MTLSRRQFIARSGLGSAALALGSKSAAPSTGAKAAGRRPRQPNLLLLWSDQHRHDVFPSADNPTIRAPNLAALAEKSFVFERAYCPQPVCTPSRGSILTGLYPHSHGAIDLNMPLAPLVKTIAEYLPADYATGYFGKWHLGDELAAQHGFREWISIEDAYRKFYTRSADRREKRSDYHHFLWENGFPPNQVDSTDGPFYSRSFAAVMSEPFTKAHFLAGEAEKFLRRRRDGQPFALSVCNLEPHAPNFGPGNNRYDPASIPTGPSWGRPVGADASRLHRITGDYYRRHGRDYHSLSNAWDLRRIRANYYGQVSMVDDAVGRILRALDESGQVESTIVVYTSDHGDMNGDHGLVDKCVFYEQAVRVPLLIHVPWLSQRRIRFAAPVSLVDLTPTLLDLIGKGAVSGLDGRSRAGELAEPGSAQPGSVIVEWHDDGSGLAPTRPTERGCDGRSIITAEGWKLNLFRQDQPELYDLNSDPEELCNLGRDAAQRERIRHLSAEISAWQNRYADALPLTLI